MKTVLFVVPPVGECSVHCTGMNVWRLLQQSKEFGFRLHIPQTLDDLKGSMPEHWDAVMIEHHPITMPWFTPSDLEGFRCPKIAIVHHFPFQNFDAYLYPRGDSEFDLSSKWFPMGRPIPERATIWPLMHDRPWIGTMGFMQPFKDYEGVVRRVIQDFDAAHIRMRVPCSIFAPWGKDNVTTELQKYRSLVHSCGKPAITIETSTEFLPVPEAVQWLSENDMNCYFYKPCVGQSRASSFDTALAAQRPIAVNRHPMTYLLMGLRPSVCVEDRTLPQILDSGIDPLRPAYEACSDANVLEDIHKAVRSVCA